jgi:beta-N-acetylhexosaminidase
VAGFRAAAATAGLRIYSPPPRKHKKGRPTVRPTTVRLVGYPSPSARGDVVVAMDTPYVLGRSTARLAKLATYGETPGAMRALVSVLLGRSTAPGHLPVPVANLSRSGC